MCWVFHSERFLSSSHGDWLFHSVLRFCPALAISWCSKLENGNFLSYCKKNYSKKMIWLLATGSSKDTAFQFLRQSSRRVPQTASLPKSVQCRVCRKLLMKWLKEKPYFPFFSTLFTDRQASIHVISFWISRHSVRCSFPAFQISGLSKITRKDRIQDFQEFEILCSLQKLGLCYKLYQMWKLWNIFNSPFHSSLRVLGYFRTRGIIKTVLKC